MYIKDKEDIPGNSISNQIGELKNEVCFINSALTLNVCPVDFSQGQMNLGQCFGAAQQASTCRQVWKSTLFSHFLKRTGFRQTIYISILQLTN